MRYLMMACVLLTAAFLCRASGGDKKEDKKPDSAWAEVTVGGEIRDLIELRGKVNVNVLLNRDFPISAVPAQWRGPIPRGELDNKRTAHVRSMQVGDSAWLVALQYGTDEENDKVLPKLKVPEKGGLPVVFHGTLAASMDKAPFVAHANGWGTMRVVEKGDKASLAMGDIQVTGKALHGKFDFGKEQFASLAVENGASPILVTGKASQEAAKIDGTITVVGTLKIQKQGPLVVEAKTVGSAPPPPK
jgi:hypothetical protein